MLVANMLNTTPIRMMVCVLMPRSAEYASERIRMSEPIANSIAITIVPAKGRPGKEMPSSSAVTAPSEAPALTPKVDPSAKGLRSSPCMAAPHSASAPPHSAVASTRGRRTPRMIVRETPWGTSSPHMAFQMAAAVSPMGTATLPSDTHRHSVAAVNRHSTAYPYQGSPPDGRTARLMPQAARPHPHHRRSRTDPAPHPAGAGRDGRSYPRRHCKPHRS